MPKRLGMEDGDETTFVDTWEPLGGLASRLVETIAQKKAADAGKAPAASHGREETPERWAPDPIMRSTRQPAGLRIRATSPGLK